jgi:hypothetical protein
MSLTYTHGQCLTCKHWEPFDEQRRSDFDFTVRKFRLGLCDKIGGVKDRRWDSPEEEILAMADDASDLQSMRTAATFGCVLWEAK